jgi:hypothetical protein
MTEGEARAIMKAHGWTFIQRSRRSFGTKYIYAQRWQKEGTAERYICPFSRLSNLTEDELIAKLTKEPTENP